MNGNMYVKFVREEQTTAALKTLLQKQQYFEGRFITIEFTYVDFIRRNHMLQLRGKRIQCWR